MWSNEIQNKIYKELEYQLDNNNFFNAEAYYSTTKKELEIKEEAPLNNFNLAYASKNKPNLDFDNTVKGISFSNKFEPEKKTNFIEDLSLENRKIYKISDLLSKNLTETIVIPYNLTPMSLSLIKRYNWRDILFSDVSTAMEMIKSKFMKVKY